MTKKINKKTVQWHELKESFCALDTDVVHQTEVQREAIPLVFLPGIMGSVLRRAGTNGEDNGPDGLPNMRWNPGSNSWMWWHYSGIDGGERRRMVIGPDGQAFNRNFLEVHNTNPIGNGFLKAHILNF